ncbi:hypothetical protein QN277_016882 [Acacia crassicarpa]|uniref:Uncharacterized protein n=1 Tax=Acacia crassicarpa TaxID=499986 RepID=A0AAE1MXN7_9FABA|nr:hypothetical protein QN277_016882 [Acacia crassicarpa]
MVSLEDSHSNSNRFPLARSYYSTTTSANNSSSRIQRHTGRSMRTIRSNFFQDDNSCSFTTATEKSTCLSQNHDGSGHRPQAWRTRIEEQQICEIFFSGGGDA